MQLIDSHSELETLTAHTEAPRAAVLLVNLGTPDAPDTRSVRRYLREFLWDPRVVEISRPVWWLILNGVIAPFRSPRSAKAYAKIWTEQGSPLTVHTRQLAGRVQSEISRHAPRVRVMWAMRYGRPGIGHVLSRLAEDNIQRLLVLPLYPHYSATTTASVFDQVSRVLGSHRWLPDIRFISHYHRHTGWLDTVADSIRSHQAEHGRPDRLLFSFHGIPRRNLLLGDPYQCQALASARRIAERLELAGGDWQVGFQSRLGRAEWLKPYTDKTLKTLARNGVKHVQVVCPGFAVDCLETLEEIAIVNRKLFEQSGGQRLDYIPCLNAGEAHARALSDLCRRHGQGWPEFAGVVDDAQAGIEARMERARARGEELGLK